MDSRNICVFDFETVSSDPQTTEICQIGACILHRITFKVLDTFESLMKPDNFDMVEDEALEINHLTREQLTAAPEASIVFHSWADWIKKWNTSKSKTSYGNPVPCGYNIVGFDLPIFDRYCKKYGYWDEKQNRQNLLNSYHHFDVFQHVWLFARTNRDLPNLKLTTVAEYMGIPKEEIEAGAHNAMWDVEVTAKIATKFFRLSKTLVEIRESTGTRRIEFRDCLAEPANA
jgi:DNA polymerase III epsilon subunit-like protein